MEHKEIEQVLETYNKDVKAHMSALAEEHQSRVSAVAEMVGALMEDVAAIKTNVEFVKGELKRKVDYDEFLALERRLSVLESKIRE